MAQTINGFIVKQNEILSSQSLDPEELAVAIGNSSPARNGLDLVFVGVLFSEIFLHE